MNTIAVKRARSGMARRPPSYSERRRDRQQGASSAHSSSGTSSSARGIMTADHARPTPKERNAVLPQPSIAIVRPLSGAASDVRDST
jgi:hypothetical protein